MSVISIGTFDGIHVGHRKLFNTMLTLGKQKNLPTVIISFKDHPSYTLGSKYNPALLCPSDIKRQQILKLGIDHVDLLDFTAKLAALSAEEFLHEYILKRWQARYIVMGYDSHFGQNREGDFEFLARKAPEYGFELRYVEPLLDLGTPVSSSRIRRHLYRGELQEANRLLGRPYRLLGTVTHGAAKGREFGFPTANLKLKNPNQLIPKEGIYFSRVHLDDDSFFGLTNIGRSPTVKQSQVTEIESYLIDFDRDLYGASLQVELLSYLREEMMFANTDVLIQAMQEDLAVARALIKELAQ